MTDENQKVLNRLENLEQQIRSLELTLTRQQSQAMTREYERERRLLESLILVGSVVVYIVVITAAWQR